MTTETTTAPAEVRSEPTIPELRAMHHLIRHGSDELEVFKPETRTLLVDNGRAVHDPVTGRYAITTAGRLEADRPDTLPPGRVTAVCHPAAGGIVVNAGEHILFALDLPGRTSTWQHWRELAADALGTADWKVIGGWAPADTDDPYQARMWRAPLQYVDPVDAAAN